jgi:Tol biopolymer transport system component
MKTVPHWALINKRWTPVKSSAGDSEKPDITEAALYINHTLFNRKGDRIYFIARGRKEKRSIWLNVPCSIKTDGTELTVHSTSIGGHPEWAEGDLMIGADDGKQIVYDVVRQKILPGRTLGNASIFPKPEGDVSLSPDGKWFVNGYASEDRESITYVVMRLADGAYVRSESFDRGPYTKGDLRTDPAPRWNRASNAILVPGWTEDGTRQLFVLKVEKENE